MEIQFQQTGKNLWNQRAKIIMPQEILDEWKLYDTSRNGNKRSSHIFSENFKNYISDIYLNEGAGIKMIAYSLGTTGPCIRTVLLSKLNIDIRRGRANNITNLTKKIRSQRALIDNSWKHPEIRDKNSYSHGIQGYYQCKNGEKIWLRSTWEYIYVKWLETYNIQFLYENKQFHLSDGTSYRPDFFILDETGNLNYLVEVKGYKFNNLYKVELLKKDYPDISIVLIDDIKPYISKDSNYNKELKFWKHICTK